MSRATPDGGSCKHENLPVKFDPEAAAGKDNAWVRKNFPRFFGPCPDCAENMIGYASFQHFIAGDW